MLTNKILGEISNLNTNPNTILLDENQLQLDDLLLNSQFNNNMNPISSLVLKIDLAVGQSTDTICSSIQQLNPLVNGLRTSIQTVYNALQAKILTLQTGVNKNDPNVIIAIALLELQADQVKTTNDSLNIRLSSIKKPIVRKCLRC